MDKTINSEVIYYNNIGILAVSINFHQIIKADNIRCISD